MRTECHRVWCGKQSLALFSVTTVSAVVDFGVKCEHKAMSPERYKEQHIMYSFQLELGLNYLYTEKGVEELKLGFQAKLRLG